MPEVATYDLFDLEFLDRMLEEGYIRRQFHPTLPLAILNYTPKAQYSREWNGVTTQCRGLIYDVLSGKIVARPFPKFFNLGELSDDEIPFEPFKVFEKMDGSLGILYRDNDGLAVATRGAFMSDQAQWATKFLRNQYPFDPRDGWTYLFEIIYPANRIVVDYGDREDLVLLDIIDNETGESRLFEETLRSGLSWPGPVVEEYDGIDALETLLARPQPLNAEGYVIRFEGGMRAKVKHDEYVRLHRIVTGVSTKTVWEYLSTGQSFEELLEQVPDEFNQWLQVQVAGLTGAYEGIQDRCIDDFKTFAFDAHSTAQTGEGRKQFALRIQDHPYKDVLFKMLDGKDYSQSIWKRLRPEYEKPFIGQTEDTA